MVERRIDGYAQLQWLSESKGGRKELPIGQYYAANIRFGDDERLWSVLILFSGEAPNEMRSQFVGLAFLFRENLENELSVGKRISIYEGPTKLVAEGKILSLNE